MHPRSPNPGTRATSPPRAVRRPLRPAGALLLAVCLSVGFTVSLGVLTAPAMAASAPPSQPGSFSISGVTSSSATLSWTEPSDDVEVLGYRIYRGTAATSDANLTLIATADASARGYTSDRLRSGFAYKFAVAALDADNNESTRASRTLTTLTSSDTTSPTSPSSSSVAATAFSGTRIDITWGTPTGSGAVDISFYEVLRNGVIVGTVERPHATRFSDNGLTPSTSYSYTVRSVDSAGNRSSLTSARTRSTLSASSVRIVRGPYAVLVDADSAVISWWTNIPTTGSVAVAGGPTVGSGTTRHHQVTVAGLAAGTQYSYTVTSGSASATGSFRTARTAGQPFSFAAIGDFGGQSTAQQQNANRIAAGTSDFLLTVGDNVYPSSGFVDPDFATRYSDLDARIFKQFATAFRARAFFPANGNKEYYGNGQFWTAFPMPGTGNSYYSFDWGDAHILVLDSLRPYESGSAQRAFAEADLAAHQSAPWQIAVVHSPPYNSTSSPTGGSNGVRNNLVPLFEQYGVDLVLSGDSHNYQRSKPLIGGVPVTAGGVTYVLTGGGGNGLNSFSGTLPSWQAFRQAVFQTLKVDVSPTALTVSAIAAADGAVLDTATMTRAPTGDTQPPSVPTGLVATPGSTSVALSWAASTDDVGVVRYHVYRDGTLVASPTTTSHTDSGLSPSTAYSYQVSAVDAAGNESAGSTPPTTTTTLAAGTGETTVQLAPVADRTIDPASTAPTSSRLKVDASSPQNDLLLKFTVPSSCPTVTAAHLKLTVGSGSTDPSAKGGDFFATSPTDPNAGWSETSVVWASAPAKTGTPVVLAGAVTSGTTYDVNVTPLVPASPGTVTIRGSNTSSDGAGYFSKEGSTTLGPQLVLTCSGGGGGGDTTPPTVPTGVGGTSTSTSVSLSWTASTDDTAVTGYEVFRTGVSQPVGTPTGTTFTDTGLASSTSYSYEVLARDAAGNRSARSAPAFAISTTAATDTTPPSVPTGVGGTSTSTSVSLSWTASTDDTAVTGYEVFRNGVSQPVGTPAGTTFTDTGLVPSTSYSYEVLARDAAGNRSARSTPAFPIATTSTSGGTVVQLAPVGDRTIDPVNTSPTSSRVKVDASSPQNDLLLKFTVPTSCPTVTAGILELTVGSGSTDPSVKGGDFFATSPTDPNAGWSETSVVWTSAPSPIGTPVVLAGAVTAGTTYDIDVTSLVPADRGTFTIRASSTSGDGAGYFSKEGSTTRGPQLVLTCG